MIPSGKETNPNQMEWSGTEWNGVESDERDANALLNGEVLAIVMGGEPEALPRP